MPNALSDMPGYCKIEKGHIPPALPRIIGICLLHFHWFSQRRFEMAEPEDRPASDSGVDELRLCINIISQTKLVTDHRKCFLNPIDIVQYIPISGRVVFSLLGLGLLAVFE